MTFLVDAILQSCCGLKPQPNEASNPPNSACVSEGYEDLSTGQGDGNIQSTPFLFPSVNKLAFWLFSFSDHG